MANLTRHSGGGAIVASILVALLLTIIPLPDWAALLRPEFAALVLLYWCIALPERVGVATAWSTGLALDVLRGALIGQHALGLTILAFLAIKLHQRIRVYPLWQQAFSVLVLITLHQLLVLWVNGIIGKPPTSWTYWLPSLSSMLIWPPLFLILRAVRRNFRVT
jgi:rod shape-determining protein MreD